MIASARKRFTASSSSAFAFSTLTATSRSSVSSTALKTVPIPPRPSLSTILYFPTVLPIIFGSLQGHTMILHRTRVSLCAEGPTMSCLGLNCPADAVYLPQVQQIVARIQFCHMADALFTALRMDAHAIEVAGSGPFQKAQVAAPEHRERLEGILRTGLVVVEARRPGVLVIADQRRAILRQHH